MEHPEAPYRVEYAGQSLSQLKNLIDQAVHLGMLSDLATAVKAIHRRLTVDPLEWGDPLYHLQHLGLLLHRGTHAPLNVIYAVDEERNLVYVTQIQPMPGSGFTGVA